MLVFTSCIVVTAAIICAHTAITAVMLGWLTLKAHITSSSAVAKRPRDASCLSVVIFNSTQRRAVFYC